MSNSMNYTLTPEQAKVANENLLQRIARGELSSVEDKTTTLLRTKQREEGFLRHIMPPIPATRQDENCQLDPETGRLYMLERFAQETEAAVISLMGDDDYEFIKQKYAQVHMLKVTTKEYQTTEDEIYSSSSYVLEDAVNSLFPSLEAAEDGHFLGLIHKLLSAEMGAPIADPPLYYLKSAEQVLTRATFMAGTKMIDRHRVDLKNILTSKIIFRDIESWDATEIGNDATTELFKNGITFKTILDGVNLFGSNKEILPENRIYYMAGGSYLGKFYEWKAPTVKIISEKGKISFYAEEWIGMIVLKSGVAVLDINAA